MSIMAAMTSNHCELSDVLATLFSRFSDVPSTGVLLMNPHYILMYHYIAMKRAESPEVACFHVLTRI